MQLFNNFDNLPENYIPNNMFPPNPPTVELCTTLDNVEPIYKLGRLVGYTWDCGEDVHINILHKLHVTVREGSIEATSAMPYPTEELVGTEGQRFYNYAELRSWQCHLIGNSIDDSYIYDWQEDETFTFVNDGEVERDIPIPMDGKRTLVQLLNFRKEVVDEREMDAEGNIIIHDEESMLGSTALDYDDEILYAESKDFLWELSREESKKLLSGIYYMNILIVTDGQEMLSNTYEIVIR